MIHDPPQEQQFLELLVAAKSAIIRYPAGYQYDIQPDTG